ncbi:MAG: S8 family serine peptidase [Cyclobacteriaceae bacterium]|nr:S8 family serine peptidase [Cyclobacteriaceae bacterium]
MVLNKSVNLGVCLFFVFFSLELKAEINRYVVYLADKEQNNYSLSQPQEFMTSDALMRRERQGIALDISDLPVSGAYLNELKLKGVPVFFSSKWLNAVLVEAGEDQLSELESLPFVSKIEFVAPGARLLYENTGGRNRKKGTQEIEISPAERASTHAQNRMLGIDKMHEKGFKGRGIKIAVFDSGFRNVDNSIFFEQVKNENRFIATRDFIRNSNSVYQFDFHGSRVLSCIAAYRENEFIGTAYESDFILCVTEDVSSEYRIEEYNWLFAAEYADSIGVDIINSSVGYSYFDDASMDYTYQDMDGRTAIISRAAAFAARKGMIVVASNGNEGNKTWRYINAPADADSIISVGSVDLDQEKSFFSSFGPTSDGRIKPELSALGAGTSIVTGNNIGMSNGTSFSTPLIAGLVAGFWQALPELSNMEVIYYLKNAASRSDSPDTLVGYGIPNFMSAYALATNLEQDIQDRFIVYPNPVDNTRKIYINSTDFSRPGMVVIDFFDLKGNKLISYNFDETTKDDVLELDVTQLIPGHYIFTCSTGQKVRKAKLIVQ